MKDFFKKHHTFWKLTLFFVALIVVVAFINYWGIFGANFLMVVNMLIGVFLLFCLGYFRGQKRASKGYIGGLQVGIIMVVIFFLISFFLLKIKMNLIQLVYYGILIISSTLGSMVGINKKKVN